MKRDGLLSGSMLKILALVFMTLDHIGMILFPHIVWLRAVGRLAFPIFAYMIAEGCFYTRSRVRYLLTLLAVAVPCQIVYAVYMQSAYQCVLVTFALSVVLIMLYECALARKTVLAWLVFACAVMGIAGGILVLQKVLSAWDFGVDYGAFGVLLPLIIYVGRNKGQRLLLCAVGLLPICILAVNLQWWCYAALPLLALYNGKRGKYPLKYLFYIYYPLHLAALYGISLLL